MESSGTQYIYIDGELTNKVACSFTVTPTKIYEKNYFCGRNENYYVYAKIINNQVGVGQIPFSTVAGFEASTQEIYKVELDRQKGRFTIRCGEEEKKYSNAYVASTPKALIFWGGQGSVDKSPNAVSYRSHARMRDISVSHDGVPTHTFIAALAPTGRPCMFDTVTKKPFYNTATSGADFIAGFNMAQAESLGVLIPANTTLTVSFPWEASLVQYNSRVESSLEQAGNKGCTISVQYREPEKDSAIYNKYEECTNPIAMSAVNADYKNDLTKDGEWIYPLTKLTNFTEYGNQSNPPKGSYLFNNATNLRIFRQTLPALTLTWNYYQDNGTGAFSESRLEYAEINAPACVNARSIFRKATKLKEGKLIAPKATDFSEVFEQCEVLVKAECNAPNVKVGYDFCFNCYALKDVIIDFNDKVTDGHNMYYNCRSLVTFPTSYASLYKGDGMFYGCRLTAQQAIEILNSLPAYENNPRPMTMGIHVDYKTDEEVLTAIANAEAKGWTVTVQWNGTATAQTVSTFGLRKPPIYAKLGTVEHPDGTIENFLDWGHYVTNAEENGYQEFASKEEAYEHFNLEIPTGE